MKFATKVAPKSRLTVAMAFVVVSILSTLRADMFSQSATGLEIRTLSSRPDMVSGGDALVEVKAPAGAQLSQLTLTLNGKDVTSRLKFDAANGSTPSPPIRRRSRPTRSRATNRLRPLTHAGTSKAIR